MNTQLLNVEKDLSEWNYSQLNENFFGMDYFYVITYFHIINFSKY
jgi:hypothetical protein